MLDLSNEVFIGNLSEAWGKYPLNLTYYTYWQFTTSLIWSNKPASTDSTLFLSKCVCFPSCCAYQYIACITVKSDLLELQPSNTCVLKAVVHHHYPRLNSPMGPFKVHVTSSMYVRNKWKGEKTHPKIWTQRDCFKEEIFITKLNSKFYLIFHYHLYKTHL